MLKKTYLSSLLTSMALLATGCADGPCANSDGPVLFAWDDSVDHRLSGTNPRAFDSISGAIEAAEPGTTVCISGGHWQENVHLRKSGIALVGAGPETTVIQSTHPQSDPRDSQKSVLRVDATDVRLEGIQLSGGQIGLELLPKSEVELYNVELRTNTIGLLSTDIDRLTVKGLALIRNTAAGASFEHKSDAPFELTLTDLRVEGNGQRGVSRVGGLFSDHPLVLTRAHFQDNTGTEAGDLLGHSLDAMNLTVGRPFVSDATPRMVLSGETFIQEASLQLLGGGLRIDCAGEEVSMVNVAISDEELSDAGPAMLDLSDCQGALQHLTLAKLVGPERGTGVLLSNGSNVLIENSALVHFSEPVAYQDSTLEENRNFLGPLSEAALLSPLGARPNLRPQRDSPLIDAAEDVGIQRDTEGWNRPLGGAPDIGAYERR